MKNRIPTFDIFINENSKSYKLYLDDIRNPKYNGWIVVRSVDDAKSYIETNGLPSEMSLDHDLGDNVPDGYDFVKWLTYEMNFDLRNIAINVHSANPVGKKNMEMLIKNFNNHYEK